MKRKVVKIVLVSILLFAASQAKAAGYHYYVDAESSQEIQNGTQDHPWKTITQALDYINAHKLKKKKVYVAGGTYRESITVRYGTKLYGRDKDSTIIDADGNQNAINFSSSSSKIKDFTVKSAEATNIIVDKKSKVIIENCKIERAGKYGIEVKDSSSAQKYKFTLKDSKVSGSGSQGLYIARRRISITGSEIFDNDEEGIDLHQGMRGNVSGNDIHGNGESGIESILSSSNFTIKGNSVNNNHAQGITVQVYSINSKGKIKITRNTIRGNGNYGIRYANYTSKLGPKKFKVFADKYVKLSRNKISGNDKGDSYYQ
jgi:parallel beta-helix repeat protein